MNVFIVQVKTLRMLKLLKVKLISSLSKTLKQRRNIILRLDGLRKKL